MKKRLAMGIIATALVAATLTGCGNTDTKDDVVDTIVSVENTIETVEETDEVTEGTENGITEDFSNNASGDIGDVVVDKSVCGQLKDVFIASVSEGKSIDDITTDLANADVLTELSVMSTLVEPGYLNGLTEEITGFTTGECVAPMIGSIPFVAYVFETDDVDALVQSLQDSHDLRWNICTSADEMIVTSVDNYVFFAMAPTTFDE